MVWFGETKELRALSRDRSRRRVEHDLTFHWQIVEGLGALAGMHNQAYRKALTDLELLLQRFSNFFGPPATKATSRALALRRRDLRHNRSPDFQLRMS
jgi:hypothetical protein